MRSKLYLRIFMILIAVIIYASFYTNTTSAFTGTYFKMGIGNHKLYETIKERAKDYEEKPIDAKIDIVWKKMPGYEGRKVNVEKSFAKMKKHGGFNDKYLVFEPIIPKVHLKDLPPGPIYRGNENKQMVAFGINVAWGNEYLPQILDILAGHKVHATFYIEGKWASKNPELVKEISDAGHEIGNHSYSHADFATISNERALMELRRTNQILNDIIKKNIALFAPPSGSYNQGTIKLAAGEGLQTILWSIDTIDWQRPAPAKILARVQKKLHPGGIVLMHPTSSTTYALDLVIETIQGQGYKIGTVSQLLSEKRIDNKVR